MELRPGFKPTEVGVIPNDWEDELLDRIAKRGSGHTPDKKHPEYWNGDIKWISLADSRALDQVFIEDTSAKITAEGIANSSAVLHPAGTVVLSRDAGVGKSAIMRTEMAVSQHFMAWRCGPELHNHYLYYWLQKEKPEFERIANGSTIKTIGLGYFRDLKIPKPPPREQRAIAAALGDVDALLVGLNRLIQKKRDLKQAAMQQLLTGQTRLPGFQGDWQMKTLEDLITSDRFAIVDGPFGSQLKVDEYVESGVPLIEMEHLCDQHVTEQIQRCITPRKFEDLKRSAVYPGDIIISKTGSLGKLGLVPASIERGLITSRLAKITVDPAKADRGFVFQCLLKLRSDGYWEKVSQGGTMQILGIGMLKSAPLPNISVVEQAAIAAVLSDMDSELTALEARRDKTRALRQGMMQELLTGRTRLV